MEKLGILTAVSSLPNKYGVGDFSSCKKFIQLIHRHNIVIWQILPLNPIGYGHSPYQPFSSFAIDELYIDVDYLYAKHLISKPKKHIKNLQHTNFEKAKILKLNYIEEAYKNFIKIENNVHELDLFRENNKELEEYSEFMARKTMNCNSPWNTWNNEFNVKAKELSNIFLFAQLILIKQWNSILEFANKLNVKILGDVPFYVGYDSSDVYYHKENFLLDEKLEPTLIAGVPPDYFSKTGQRWGNPIYNWEYLYQTDFEFLIKRLEKASKLYNIIRLDHFRAFDSYWGINPKCDTAIDGQWYYPNGYAFFNKLYSLMPNIELLAEDLGDLRPEVITLKNHYNLSGMCILQFSVLDEILNHVNYTNPHNVYYTGTHDNDSLKGFINKLTRKEQIILKNALLNLGYENIGLTDMLLLYAMQRKEELVIIPAQDFLKLNGRSRMNMPSTINKINWTFRLTNLIGLDKRLQYLTKEMKKCIK